jgi:hypothetical protein
MLFGAVTQVLRGELMLSAMLFGAALSIKVGTVAFLVPAAVAFGIAVKGRMQTAVAAALLLAGLAAPPYLNAWLRTGNPIFPFANQFFKSPDFDLAPLQDLRFHAKVGWTTPYEATFRSSKFYEGQNGGLGFQYWLLLPAVILLLRRGAPWKLFGIAAAGAILSFVSTPNLRYLYPSLPLFSLAIAWAIVELPLLAPVAIAIGLANFAFLESSGWYHKDFAAFTPAGARKYLEEGAPQRLLIDRLNRETPGEPVAFFNGAAIAGLHARAYSDTWHSYPYWTRMGGARSSDEVAAIYRELGIHRIVAPFPLDRWQSPYPSVDNFLDDWTQPTGITAGAFGLFELRTAPLPHDQRGPAPAGAYDDVAREIEYRGSWIRDRQFSPASGGTLTYANSPGDLLRFSFAGRAITYIYTRALNRGIAQVLIDGQERARIDLYSRITEWQARTVFGNLGDGPHVIEIRVLDSANPRSSDRYVDLDAFIVE